MNQIAEYKSSLCSLKNLLGLGCIHIFGDERLMPWISKIISVLNEKLIMEDKDLIEDNIKLFIDIYEEELELILSEKSQELIERYGYSEPSDLFFIAWTNIFSTIYIEELYNYSYLFTDSPIDCHECCGNTKEDENGNLVFIPEKNNISSKYYCGCGK